MSFASSAKHLSLFNSRASVSNSSKTCIILVYIVLRWGVFLPKVQAVTYYVSFQCSRLVALSFVGTYLEESRWVVSTCFYQVNSTLVWHLKVALWSFGPLVALWSHAFASRGDFVCIVHPHQDAAGTVNFLPFVSCCSRKWENKRSSVATKATKKKKKKKPASVARKRGGYNLRIKSAITNVLCSLEAWENKLWTYDMTYTASSLLSWYSELSNYFYIQQLQSMITHEHDHAFAVLFVSTWWSQFYIPPHLALFLVSANSWGKHLVL